MRAVSMKSMVVFLALVFSASVFANGPKKDEQFINKAKSCYLKTLDSDYNSIVESSIFITMDLKSRYPSEDYDELIDKLNELAVEGKTPTIRYKAQLASLYFNYQNLFTDIKFTDKENPEQSFQQISEKLGQRPVVAVN
jgi:hypothetical protein